MSSSRLDVWPSLPPHIYLRRPAAELPYPLSEPGCSLFELGRHALWHGLAQLGLRAGDELLVPAYHHGSEIEALARAGLVCRFYDARADLAPDELELDRLSSPKTRGLYVIHYLGFPQDAPRWRRWCDDRGLLLIEDAAQAWLASIGDRPVGSFGDLAFFCLYKTFGFPDGAAAVVRHAAPTGRHGRRPLRLGRLARRHAAWAAQRSPRLARIISRIEPAVDYSPERELALRDPTTRLSAATMLLLARVDADAAATRRLHYDLLLEELRDLVPTPFDQLPDGASPFMFPITAAPKRPMIARLAEGGIRALDFWSTAHRLSPDGFPGAAARRGETVGLPVHQELTAADVERVAHAVRPRRSRAAALRLEPLESLDGIADEWSELALRSRNIFATWEWASSWWRHCGGRGSLRAFAARSASGRLIAILPLYLSPLPALRVIRFVGHGAGDQLGPICAPDDRRTAARQLRRLLSDRRPEWDVFVGEQLPREAQLGQLLGARVVGREGSPVLRAAGGWDAYLAARSANLRQQIRRRERALAHSYEVRYRLADDASRLQEDLDVLFALHRKRWERSPFAGAHEPFHREFAARALEQGWLRLWFLELDGSPRAAWYGFRFEGAESYYQAGRDPAWASQSVGFALLAHSIRAALEDGIREYRFLRGHEPFKYRFADSDPGLETVVLTHGARGSAAVAAAEAARAGLRRSGIRR